MDRLTVARGGPAGARTLAAETARADLVRANRILAHEGILEAYGHVSIRDPDHPGRFLLARSRSPGLVELGDLLDFDLDGTPVAAAESTDLYIERFIHAAIYAARPGVQAVCHNHAMALLPFCVSRTIRLRAVIHSAGFLGDDVPVWDIADEFGDATDLLVRDLEQGRSLARAVGDGSMALMRGHGSVIVARDVRRLVGMCDGIERNARALLSALAVGEVRTLNDGEIATRRAIAARERREEGRAWEYFVSRAGCEQLSGEPSTGGRK